MMVMMMLVRGKRVEEQEGYLNGLATSTMKHEKE
jgi:hypothetical protein